MLLNDIIAAIKDYRKQNKKNPSGRFKLTKEKKLTNASANNPKGFNIKLKKSRPPKFKNPKKPKKSK